MAARFDGKVPFDRLRPDQTVAIAWSAAGPPRGDELGGFEHVRPVYVGPDDLVDSGDDEERIAAFYARAGADGARCGECGAPLPWAGQTCVCGLADPWAA